MSAQDPWASTTTVELGTNGQSQDPAPTPPKEQPEFPKNNMTNETTGGAAPGATPPADQTDKDKGGNKPPEPDRIKLELPSGAEPPTMGFPKLVQRWYNFWQTEDPANPGYLKVATPNAEEQAIRAKRDQLEAERLAKETREAEIARKRQKRKDYMQALIRRLRYLANEGITPIIIFAANKSCGKSTNVLGVGCTIKWYTQKSTIAFPATTNVATATLGEMSGITGNSMSINEFAVSLAAFGTTLQLEKRLPLTDQGLAVLTEDVEDAANEDDADYAIRFVESVDVIRTKYSVIIEDGGNDSNSKQSLALQSIRLAHVINFVYTQSDQVSKTRLKGMVKGLWQDDGIPEDVEQKFFKDFKSIEETGYHIPTREKIANAVVIANKVGFHPGEGEVDFDDVMFPASDVNAETAHHWSGTGIKVGWDPSIGRADEKGNLIPFDLFAAAEDQQIAWLEIAVANFELAGAYQGYDIGEPMVAQLPKKYTQHPSRKELQ